MMVNITPKFSIVIPTFNRSHKIKETLDSVIAQSFQDYEVLVMDDGSTDDTEAVVESFRDARIRYEWEPNSGGPATPRNRGIDKAKADWVCFLDADDLWYPGKLQCVNEAITQNPDVDLICHNELMSVLSTQRKTLMTYGPSQPDLYRLMLTMGNRLSTSAVTVKRRFLNEKQLRFNQSPSYVIVEDYDMWLRIALSGGAFHFMNDVLGEYIIDNDNISLNNIMYLRNLSALLHDHVYSLQLFDADKDRLWREINAGLLVSRARRWIASGKYVEGYKSLRSAWGISKAGSVRYFLMKALNAAKQTKESYLRLLVAR